MGNFISIQWKGITTMSRNMLFTGGAIIAILFGIVEVQISGLNKHVETIQTEESERDIIRVQRRFIFSQRDLQCLAKNIYYEAGVEDIVGKYAVATVTINRLKTQYWGGSICKVVYAKSQFSWTLQQHTQPLDNQLWEQSMIVAKDVLMDGARVRGLTHSLFYHADYIRTPNWANKDNIICKIGSHVFYTQAKDSWLSI
ncbi:MAG TPA: cell wall hydrolase [Methanosarcina sp.]|nr:cell wall hydrolase [Methanosarcina sp.]